MGRQREPEEQKVIQDETADQRDPAHAGGHRHVGPPPVSKKPGRRDGGRALHDQPWVPTSRLTGRRRGSARRG